MGVTTRELCRKTIARVEMTTEEWEQMNKKPSPSMDFF